MAENIYHFLKAGTGANWRDTKKLQDCPVISDHGHGGHDFHLSFPSSAWGHLISNKTLELRVLLPS
jgi:hypothetical protein